MDPFTIASSVAGLRKAASDIYNLWEIASKVKDAPTTVHDAKSEVAHAQMALQSMERCLNKLATLNPERTALIQVDDLRATLSDAVMAFSEFENTLEGIARLARFRRTIVWPKYSKAIEEHLAKIQRYNSSLILMTNILQCETHIEATESQTKLQSLIEGILNENQVLRRMMTDSQDSFDAISTFAKHAEDGRSTIRFHDDNDDAATIHADNGQNTMDRSRESIHNKVFPFAFERILEQSWVYKRNQRNECDCSFISSAQRSHAWSVFSGFSLADISVLSVIAMPITPLDITNGRYYEIGIGQGKPPEKEIASDAPQFNRNSFSSDLQNMGHFDFEFKPALSPLLNSEENQTPSEDTELTATIPAIDQLWTESWNTVGSTKHDNLSKADHDVDEYLEDSSSEKREGLFPCKGCGEILEEGKAFELAGNKWHIDCYRCNTCDTLLHTDSSVLLLGDGSLICDSCTYSCSACGNRIEDLAILTGDQAFCAPCFRCRNCKRKIENLRYARTSQGIFCMGCHERLMARRRRKAKEAAKARLESACI